ncbi:MAG: TPM domain-containing protein [Cyclobacteriaceae bacterium]|nr:TPM domain-containing protein [Cyclobacteriaceae bacterium]MCH8514752.1 TPM domain-containing protein [Cyclobacteriaceae bacterium]
MPEYQFSEEEKKRLSEAVASAEKYTSGEIQIHIEDHCPADVLDHAADVFEILKMHKTKERNAVLFYVALEDHQFAILGDVGINSKVEGDFWDSTKDLVINFFKQGQITEGLIKGVEKAGKKLNVIFPLQGENTNELPNEVSFKSNRKKDD